MATLPSLTPNPSFPILVPRTSLHTTASPSFTSGTPLGITDGFPVIHGFLPAATASERNPPVLFLNQLIQYSTCALAVTTSTATVTDQTSGPAPTNTVATPVGKKSNAVMLGIIGGIIGIFAVALATFLIMHRRKNMTRRRFQDEARAVPFVQAESSDSYISIRGQAPASGNSTPFRTPPNASFAAIKLPYEPVILQPPRTTRTGTGSGDSTLQEQLNSLRQHIWQVENLVRIGSGTRMNATENDTAEPPPEYDDTAVQDTRRLTLSQLGTPSNSNKRR
ncbi:hypothetical protein BDZ97DRAFT_1808271 [Flammula alnicola]|nr:hypothetical protein BDZ97DRAFT_1808271 [Flammula alnicola]